MEVFDDPFYVGKMGGLRYKSAYRPKVNLLGKIVKNRGRYDRKYLEGILDKDFMVTLSKRCIKGGECVYPGDYVEVFETVDMGKGIRVKRDLRRGVEIGCYLGELKGCGDNSDGVYDFAYALRGFYVDGRNGSLLSFCNHSDRPNVDVIWRMHNVGNDELHLVFRVNRDVREGEELFIDYGEEYWEGMRKRGVIKTTRQRLITEFFVKN